MIPWRRKWQPTLVFLPGKASGWRSLVGDSPWGRKEWDKTEQLSSSSSGMFTHSISWLPSLDEQLFESALCLRKGPRSWSLACKKQGTNRLLCPGAHRVLLSFHTKQWGQCKTGRSFTGGLCEFRSVEQFGEIIWIFSEFHCIPQPHYSIPWIYLRKCFHIYSRNITVLFSNVSWP